MPYDLLFFQLLSQNTENGIEQFQKLFRIRQKLRLLVYLAVIFSLFLYILTSYFQPSSLSKGAELASEVADPYNKTGLILDTAGCRIPKFDPFDEQVKPLISLRRKPYACRGKPAFMVTLPNSTIVLNETILRTSYRASAKDVSCKYRAIFREKEAKGSARENSIRFGDAKELRFGVPIPEEFLQINCILPSKKFTQYIPLVPIKPEVEKRASRYKTNGTDALNVILIGIDSVSKLNFLRHFRKTHEFLVTKMSAFDMKGYNKVGDNTFPNLVPLLTGNFVEHYWNETVRNTMFFDNLDFVWKAYASKGYRTFYAEDGSYTGTFNYLKRGFEHPPTDYYYRPLGLAIENSDLKKTSTTYCLNNQLEMSVLYRYLMDFVKTMKDKLFFSFTMVSSVTHDQLNDAGHADEPTYELLKELQENGAMNKSIVVVFSDHGIRFGSIRETYIGKFEERMPFMYLTLPEWYMKKHDKISSNLRENQNRLITLFDIHATLRHLLDVSNATLDGFSSSIKPNGLSLLGSIPEYRTCEAANILPHWCPCQVYQYISPNDKTVIRASSAVVNEINRQFPFGSLCAPLEVDKVTDARIGHANEIVLRFVNHHNDVENRQISYGEKVKTLTDFLITFRARPGGGMFEGTVRHDVRSDTFKVLGISRINMYGTQSACIDSQILKKFCFCMRR